MSRLAAPVAGVPTRIVPTARGPLALIDLPAWTSAATAGPAVAARSAASSGGTASRGEAGVVLCVPGYTGSKEDFGPLLAPLAAAGYRAIAVDQRGQYESPGTQAAGDYTLDALAADLLALLDALRLPAVHLIGHSFGGLVCRELVLEAPRRSRSLTLLGSGPAAIGGDRAAVIEALRPLVVGADSPVAWGRLAESLSSSPFGRARYRASSPAALLGMATTLLTAPDRTTALARAVAAHAIPVLVAHGGGDDAWPPAVQREMAGRLGARYEIIEQAAHSPAVEAPAATAALVLDALASWGG